MYVVLQIMKSIAYQLVWYFCTQIQCISISWMKKLSGIDTDYEVLSTNTTIYCWLGCNIPLLYRSKPFDIG